ncbi:HAD hydrolase-like protein, partial [Acinetobacter baumannii]
TRPTDLGLEPGVGTQVNAVRACFPDREPLVAGKPFPALLRETERRLGSQHPIFVGDRLDTDILGAFNTQMDSLFVFTGAHGVRDLVEAVPQERP